MVERGYNQNYYAFYANLVSLIFFIGILLFQGQILQVIEWLWFLVLMLSFVNMALLTISVNSRVASLKNIDTVIFYPLYKTFSPILITIASLVIFQEILSFREVIGIVVWISVPLLLLTKTEDRIQKNLYKGFIFMAITVILWSIASVMPKIAHVQNLNIDTFILWAFLTGVLFSSWILLFQKPLWDKQFKKAPYHFWIILGLSHFWGSYFFIHALTGNLAVVFTINSFSILVPIILSIIFYGEHFNLKKGIVIALSIVSILLFI